MITSCKDCKKRRANCHAECDDYLAFLEDLKIRKEKIKEEKFKDHDIRMIEYERVKRYKANRRRGGKAKK